jgi:primosomal protein N'
MREIFGERVYGPHAPVIEKLAGEHIMTILLKIENGRSFAAAKGELSRIMAAFARESEYRKLTLFCNVDPQ